MPARIIVLLFVAASAGAQSRLPEGTVAYWNCDRLEASGWRDNDWATGGSGRLHFDADVKLHGEASLRLEGAPEGSVSAISLERPAEVDTARSYVLQVWMKTAGVKGSAQVRALAHGPRADGQYHPLGWLRLSDAGHFSLNGDSDWVKVRLPIEKMPGGTTRVFFYLLVEGEGTAWFDEFSFAEAGVEVPLGGEIALRDEDYAGKRFEDADLPDNLLVNGGFEEGMAGWQMLPADYSARVDASQAHSGTHSFRFDAKEFTGCYLHQTVDIDPRRYYRISLFAKTEALVGFFFTHLLPRNRHNVPLGWHGENHANEHHTVTGTTDGWEERVLVTRFAPEAAGVTFFPRVEDTIGTVWIDDLVIRPLPLDYQPGGHEQ